MMLQAVVQKVIYLWAAKSLNAINNIAWQNQIENKL
jgi:hypothetical protein